MHRGCAACDHFGRTGLKVVATLSSRIERATAAKRSIYGTRREQILRRNGASKLSIPTGYSYLASRFSISAMTGKRGAFLVVTNSNRQKAYSRSLEQRSWQGSWRQGHAQGYRRRLQRWRHRLRQGYRRRPRRRRWRRHRRRDKRRTACTCRKAPFA